MGSSALIITPHEDDDMSCAKASHPRDFGAPRERHSKCVNSLD
jgi:hypothetical protein